MVLCFGKTINNSGTMKEYIGYWSIINGEDWNWE